MEQQVLAVLQAYARALTPGEVQQALNIDLAYTTVMTTLARLYGKGELERVRSGRAFAYSPVGLADEHAAQAMSDVLSRVADRAAVLTWFVRRLRPDEEAALRRLLDRAQEAAGRPT